MHEKKLPSKDSLMKVIQKTLTNSWHINNIHEARIEMWLSNFRGNALKEYGIDEKKAKEREEQIALFLLCNFVYYNEEEVKYLMQFMLRKYIHEYYIRRKILEINDSDINILMKTTGFAHLGNSSESSAYMLYLFRQVNDLAKENFDDKKECKNLVYIDDFSISGAQAEWYLKKNINEINKKENIYILLMISTDEAVKRIKKISNKINVISCVVLDDSSKAFSENSIIFQGYPDEVKQQAKRICQYYGDLILSDKEKEDGITAFGYNNQERLIGTYYNTPNNTLPIFWMENGLWKPIFKRYDKKYENEGVLKTGIKYV